MEIRVTLQELLAKTNDIQVVDKSDRLRSNLISGTKHLTVRVA